MRIFIGLEEIANVVANYAKGFRALGHETYTMVSRRSPFYPEAKYDLVLEDVLATSSDSAWPALGNLGRWKRVMLSQFIRALRTNDVFIFVFATSFFPRFVDYPVLKLFRKKIVSVFLGSDVRYWYAFRERFRSLPDNHRYACPDDYRESYGYLQNGFDRQLTKVRAAERYSDLILSQPSMDQLQSRPYMRVNIPLDLSQLRFGVPDRRVPIVLHAPTHRESKGTAYVIAAVEQLRRDGVQFDFRLVENVPNGRLREMLTDADIVIDQMLSTTVATLALESMASGNAVLARYLPEFSGIPADCPVVNVTPASLVEKLRAVIVDRDHRRAVARGGRSYVEKHHDHVRVAGQILGWLGPQGIREYDFIPTFFTNQFVMPRELLESERRNGRERRVPAARD